MYAGSKIYNEKNGADVQLLGWDAAKQTGTFVGGDNPWGDPAKGEQLAKTFLDQGVDIVHPVAGATGNGTIKAMLAAGKWAIGVDTDQAISLAEYAPAILTSAQKVIDVAVLETIKKNSAGDLGGENFLGTLANGGVALSPYHDLDSKIPADLKAQVDQLKADIASGTRQGLRLPQVGGHPTPQNDLAARPRSPGAGGLISGGSSSSMRLELKDITKRFPGVLANDRISISADRGEVLGLLGENGAGKTTLMNILSGLYRPDLGEILIDDAAADVQRPAPGDRRRDRDGAPALPARPGVRRRRGRRAGRGERLGPARRLRPKDRPPARQRAVRAVPAQRQPRRRRSRTSRSASGSASRSSRRSTARATSSSSTSRRRC